MRAWSIVLLVGCGGGPSIPPPPPKVELLSSQCTVEGSGFLDVKVDFSVTIDVEQAFEATINFGPVGTRLGSTYTCGSWRGVFVGGDSRGCERDESSDRETELIQHTFNADLPSIPTQFSVSILGSALDVPLSNFMIANASRNEPCLLPPMPLP